MELCDSKTMNHDLYYCGHVHSELSSFLLKPLLRNCHSVSVGWNFIYYLLHSGKWKCIAFVFICLHPGEVICDGDDTYGQLCQTALCNVVKVACGWAHALFCMLGMELYLQYW
jgi:hypothetical protein